MGEHRNHRMLAISVLVWILILGISIQGLHASGISSSINQFSPVTPEVLNASIENQSSTVQFNSGGSLYFYTAVDGGGVSLTNPSFNVQSIVVDGNGFVSAEAGYSTLNKGSVNTNGAAYYAISGVEIGSTAGINTSLIQETNIASSSNGSYGANYANLTFQVVASNSLVVVTAAGSSNANPHFTSSFSLNVLDMLSSTVSIIQGYSVVNAGSYNVSVSMTNVGTNPDGSSVLLQVYVIPPANFAPAQKYPVYFKESGLPSGTTWHVTLGNKTESSSNNTIEFNVYNGTYHYYIHPVNNLYPSPESGNVTINGGVATVGVAFYPPMEYSISFVPNSNIQNVEWWVTFNGTTKYSNGSAEIVFSAVNGTYTYSIGVENGYNVTPSSGLIVVNGSSVITSVYIIPKLFTVIVTESGLPPGTTWSITVNGNQYSSQNNTIILHLADGTYTITINPVQGYSPSPSKLKVSVNNENSQVKFDYLYQSPASLSMIYSPSILLAVSLIVFLICAAFVMALIRGGRNEL